MSSAVKFSGSNGAAMEFIDVSVSIGNNDILSKINWAIMPKERWVGKMIMLDDGSSTKYNHVS